MKNIIGISAYYHDSACCLLQNGRLIAAAHEERFSRIKHDAALPYQAFQYCLREGGIHITDIDAIAYYEDPDKKVNRQFANCEGDTDPEKFRKRYDRTAIQNRIADGLGYEGDIIFIDHHRSHAASAFYFSGFSESALLTVDGVGEWATTTYGTGNSQGITLFEEIHFPHSIGLLYSTITSYLGFEVNEGEYKVMGLAPYGKKTYVEKVRRLIHNDNSGSFKLAMEYFDFRRKDRMYSDQMMNLLDCAPRKRGAEVSQVHKDLARSLQEVLEEVLMSKVHYLYEKTKLPNLCMAGGVALNCVANGKIIREGPFKNVFIQPAANDAGGAIGAAAEAYTVLSKRTPPVQQLNSMLLGPGFNTGAVEQTLKATKLVYTKFAGREPDLLMKVCEALQEGKVVGWFQGRMEFGPRALGARSILADPRLPDMRDKVNFMVKKREGFRPFAPVVLLEEAAGYFQLNLPSPFMLQTCEVQPGVDMPAITHTDNSARVQTADKDTNPRLYALLQTFKALTGCPVLLNTSFNIKDEPIVCTPADAIKCFMLTGIDCLVVDDFYIDRNDNSLEAIQFIIETIGVQRPGINHNIYSFL